MLEYRMRSYYKHAFYGNRGLFARAVDFIALRVVIFVLSYLWFSTLSKDTVKGAVLAAILTLMVTVALELCKNIRLENFIAKKRNELCREYLFEQLVVMQRDSFLTIVSDLITSMGYTVVKPHPFGLICSHQEGLTLVCAMQNHPDNPVEAQQVLDCYRAALRHNLSSAILISTSPFSEKARSFSKKLNGFSLRLISREKLLNLAHQAHMLPDEQQVEEALALELEQKQLTLKRLKKEALSDKKTKAYAICGIILFIAAYVTGQMIYYPAMAGVCFTLAFISYFTGQNKRSVPRR